MSRIAPKWVGLGVGIVLVAAVVGSEIAIHYSSNPKVVFGKNDEVFYYRRATRQDAVALGRALQSIGFFNDRGTSVLLWMGGGPTIVAFVMNEGAWNHPGVVSNFSEIGRRVANSVGGFPIEVHLVDSRRTSWKKMNVGRTVIGSKDVLYYFGAATIEDAQKLGQALRSAGYFADRGFTVELLKGEGTVVSFVVQDGLWDNLAAVATLDGLVRQVAPSAGGLPVKLRLVDAEMTVKKELMVE